MRDTLRDLQRQRSAVSLQIDHCKNKTCLTLTFGKRTEADGGKASASGESDVGAGEGKAPNSFFRTDALQRGRSFL